LNRVSQHKGRASLSNPAGRFEATSTEACDDGWSLPEEPEPTRVATEVKLEPCHRIITRNDSPDVPFNASINPYRGCEHGCIYCFARPSHSYLGWSAGLDFETRIVAKPNAAQALRRQLAARSYRVEPIVLGANTDPYQPVEAELGITRELLQVFLETRHPVGLITKGAGILRDADLLEQLAQQRLVHVYMSVTTLDPELARRMEPRAASPKRRLATLERLAHAGVPVGVLVSPIIPALNDHEIERIVAAAAASGARRVGAILLRLPHEVKTLFSEWLQRHYPDRAEHVLGRLREARGGKLYESAFGERMRGRGPYADMIQARFEAARVRHGLSRQAYPFDASRFRPPPRDVRQLELFPM
jgi:DNA repair photolyase